MLFGSAESQLWVRPGDATARLKPLRGGSPEEQLLRRIEAMLGGQSWAQVLAGLLQQIAGQAQMTLPGESGFRLLPGYPTDAPGAAVSGPTPPDTTTASLR